MQVTNTTGLDLYLAELQVVVINGESITVDDDYGASLIAQGWKTKTTKQSAKAATTTTDTVTEEGAK